MAEPRYEIQSVTFMQDGAVVQYVDVANDVRVKGAVMRQQQVSLSAKHPDYRDDIEGLHHRAVRMLKNALEDFEESDPVEASEELDEEQIERGMGDH